MIMKFQFIFVSLFFLNFLQATVELGVDVLFSSEYSKVVHKKKVGLITNQTGINKNLESTIHLFQKHEPCTLAALFSPEHGIHGSSYAGEKVYDSRTKRNIPVYSLHGDTRRPTKKMLEGIDVLVFDIQDIGSRSYTYASTLFYVMEEAAKNKIPVVVLDRPNPINGVVVDGPMMQDKFRSFVGYVNVPYCHGMTIGELSLFFNEEYKIGCHLTVVPMEGWKRTMSYKDTGLQWVPTSPYIPEQDTPFFYASTGILGVLEIVNIGIGYTQPFKLIGAPWIKAEEFARHLNEQKLPGVTFLPFYYKPFYGLYKNKDCEGVKIMITDPLRYKPIAVQYLVLGILKTLYPSEIQSKLSSLDQKTKKFFSQVNGNDEIYSLLLSEKYIAWKLIEYDEDKRQAFLEKRKKYLLY